jgi:hypothetical protein
MRVYPSIRQFVIGRSNWIFKDAPQGAHVQAPPSTGLVETARRSSLDDLGLLKNAQLYQTDRETGKSGVTLANILLLGKR